MAGDMMIIIAKEKLGITLPALVAASPQVADPNKINAGDVLNVPLCNATAGGAGGKNGTATATLAKSAAKSATPTKSAKAKVTGSKMRRGATIRKVGEKVAVSS